MPPSDGMTPPDPAVGLASVEEKTLDRAHAGVLAWLFINEIQIRQLRSSRLSSITRPNVRRPHSATSLGYLTFDRCAAFVLTTVPVRHVEGIAELLMISFVSIESGFCYGLRATQHRLFLR